MNTAKHAEFANLFATFSNVASRRSRTIDSHVDPKAFIASLDEGAIPKDLAPVIRNLYSLVDTHPNIQKRTRRNTVAAEKFPLDEQTQHRFTFKKMLHDIYELDDWKKKVESVLSDSQSQFKSLAELEKERLAKPDSAKKGDEPRVRWDEKVNSPSGGGRRAGVAGRTRSHTVTGAKLAITPTHDVRAAPAQCAPLAPIGDVRIVKKRCVGRRPSATGETKHWVYASAVSSVEVSDARHSSAESLASKEVVKGSKYQSLQEDGKPRQASARRRVTSMGGEGPSLTRKRPSFSIAKVSDMGDVYGSSKKVACLNFSD